MTEYATGGIIPGDPCTCDPTRESVMTPDGHVRCAYITFHESGCPSRIESTTTYIRRGSPL